MELVSDYDVLPPTIVLTIGGLLVSGVVTYVMLVYVHIRIPIQTLLYIFAIGGSMVLKRVPELSKYVHGKAIDSPDQIISVCFSLFALRAAYSIDKKKFFKLLPLMFVASLASFVSGFAHGFLIKVVRDHHSYEVSKKLIHFMHGFMFCTTQPYFISSIFVNMENFMFFHNLLQGESLFINTITLTLLDILRVWESASLYSLPQIIIFIFFKLLGGIPIGALFGKLTSLVIIYLDFDSTTANVVIIAATVLTFNLAEFFVASPYITVTIFICFIMFDSKKFSKDNYYDINTVLEIVQLVIDIFIAMYCIVQIVYEAHRSTFGMIHFMLFNFVMTLICRFVVFTLFYLIIRKFGYPYNFQMYTFILSWSSIISTNILCMGLIIDKEMTKDTAEILPYLLFNYIGSLLISSPGVGISIKFIYHQRISQPKVANMNVIIKHFMEIRDNSVYVLKMNRFMADVNWKYVRNLTEIEHAYSSSEVNHGQSLGISGTPSCPFCDKELLLNLNYQNTRDIKRETRKHIWNYMKTIIVRQYEMGMVSNDSLLYIQNIFEESLMDESFGTINIHKLENGFRKSKTIDVLNVIYKKFFSFQRCNILVPRRPCRRVCYKIVMHKAFNIIVYIIIIGSCVPIFLDFTIEFHIYSIFLSHVLFIIFFVECILNILAYSWIFFWKHGCKAYLRSFWHILDIFTLIFSATEIIISWFYIMYRSSVFSTCFIFIRPVRCVRIFRIFSGKFPRIMALAENQFEARLLNSYEIVKSIREAMGEFLIVMDRVIAPSDSRKEYYEKLVADCDKLYKLMLKVHIDYPWISTTIKTKQIIHTCKYVMLDTLTNLKLLGYVDEIEYHALAVSIKGKDASQKAIKKIKIPHAISMFFGITWMTIEDSNVGDFLYSRSSVRAFEEGYTLGQVGDYLDGVIIIIQGMLKVVYTPNETTSNNFKHYGVLPIIDGLDDTDLNHAFEIYIFPGNTIGELNILTGRQYDCAVVCVTEVRAYFINIKYISEAFRLSTNPVIGLECMMWKHSVLNLATTILLTSNVYEFNTYHDIHVKLERSLCPDLTGYQIFAVNNIIEDILLLDGVVFDAFTRAIYRAPCHIPRSVVKIDIFFKKMYAKLIIIPIADIDNTMLRQIEPNTVELVSSDESRPFEPKIKKRKKKSKSKYDSSSGSRSSSMGRSGDRSSKKSLSHSIVSDDY